MYHVGNFRAGNLRQKSCKQNKCKVLADFCTFHAHACRNTVRALKNIADYGACYNKAHKMIQQEVRYLSNYIADV